MRGADVVRSSQAPEVDIIPELGNWAPPYGRAANQNAANFSYAPAQSGREASLIQSRFRRAAGAPYGEEAVHSVNTAVADGLKRVLRAFSDQESLAHTAARKSGGERRKGMKSRKWMIIALFAALTIT